MDTQIQAAGLVYVSQTGDIGAPGSITWPGSNNTSVGFRCYRFNDGTNQTTLPIFVRFEWGRGTLSAVPRIIVQVGTALNGSGTLTGQVGTSATLIVTAMNPGDTLVSYCAAGDGYFHLVTNFNPSSNSNTGVVIVERPHKNGLPTTDGILVVTAAATLTRQIIPPSGTVTGQATSTNAQWQPNSTGQETVSGTNPSFWPMWYLASGKMRHTRALLYAHARVAELTALDGTSSNNKVSFNGTPKSYLAMGDGVPNLTANGSSSETLAIATD